MVLVLSALAKQPEPNFVNMATRGAGQFRKSYEGVLTNDAIKMQGRMLSLYDRADTISGTCDETAKPAARLKMTEEALEVGAGHGTFYTPLPEWVDRIATWVGPAGTPKTN
jgi:hypothetical protein